MTLGSSHRILSLPPLRRQSDQAEAKEQGSAGLGDGGKGHDADSQNPLLLEVAKFPESCLSKDRADLIQRTGVDLAKFEATDGPRVWFIGGTPTGYAVNLGLFDAMTFVTSVQPASPPKSKRSL